ncbi:deoxyribose-phosphate aldolase [Chromohalobacter marismortui]|uniref:Deoxyribose-phosphate aldolase n=1 Tax=Chromohalobacter marismortui TaxID=42055 RepID=A0A4R7NSG7_9GAMM|nr:MULTISPECIES: deoxyribose-phosphate aldolase [Chromohalobacter]MCI0509309.1 deoxyribose-phosphate aldolase [Chromohalobacter sp.]MCI0593857.1 deoxyribose-phosphate aldolase [Chromohalobacter sp.]TDU23798.1 deoxyribose-phosphate aldolase [Chromohalobacter marismortui]
MTDLKPIARQALALMDLTSLNDDDDSARIQALCRRADTPVGHPAALCLYPAFIEDAQRELDALGLIQRVRIATVTNFPDGAPNAERAARETRLAVAAGADEVDVVFPYRALLDGAPDVGRLLVEACREACGGATLKVILETGELQDPTLIRQAAEIAIAAGADFIKTSTGKVAVNATLEAAEIMLETIRDSGRDVGFKAAGGIRTSEDAKAYLELAARIMGEAWISPAHFRFGASGLLDALLATLEVGETKAPQEGY